MLHCHAESLLAQMRSLQDNLLHLFKGLKVFLAHRLLLVCVAIENHVLPARDNDLLVDVPDEGLDKGRADTFNPFFQPHVIVQKVAFSGQDTQIYCKIVILTVNNLDETIFDFLRDVEHSA